MRASGRGASVFADPPDFDWSLCRVFLAVFRAGSMLAAASRLGESRPTVRRRIAVLEDTLGAPLFMRSSEGVRPTLLAKQLLPFAEEMETTARRVAGLAGSRGAAGTLRIAAEGLLLTWLVPAALIELRRAPNAPKVQCLSTGSEPDIARSGAGVALSWSRPARQSLVISRLATVRLALYASAEWAAAPGRPRTVEGLAAAGGLIGGVTQLRCLRPDADPGALRDRLALRTDDDHFALAAVTASLGAALLPEPLAATMTGLVAVSDEPAISRDVWLSMHPDLKIVPEVRLLVRALRAALAVD